MGEDGEASQGSAGGGKDTRIERNESGEEPRRVFHLQAGLSRPFIIRWRTCALVAPTHLPAGREDASHFQRARSAASPLGVASPMRRRLGAKWGGNKSLMCTYSEEQVTIIYSEISRPIVPDEFEWKWRVKAGNGRSAIERNQDAGAFEEAPVRETRGG